MRHVVLALLTLSMVLIVGQAMALDQPTVTSPREGATLGPNYDVVGKMPSKAFVVVMTDIVNCDTNETIGSVPGIRHWTDADGSFHFRVAAPRISFGEKEMSISYRVRVFEANPNENGQEVALNTECANQTIAEVTSSMASSEQGREITVTSPSEGDALGPNYDISGRASGRVLLVVLTDVVNAQTSDVIRTVPGIRHYANADGSFHFRVASPRVSIGEKQMGVSYRIRVFEASRGENGPETTINATMAQ